MVKPERDSMAVTRDEALLWLTLGWEAAERLNEHEWGPEPARTPRAALAQLLDTCVKGHKISVVGARCPECKAGNAKYRVVPRQTRG